MVAVYFIRSALLLPSGLGALFTGTLSVLIPNASGAHAVALCAVACGLGMCAALACDAITRRHASRA